jgi:hypothetical protein
MSATTQLSTEPLSFRSGDIVEFVKSFSDYSAADGWSCYYRLVNSANAYTAIQATADGTSFVISIPKATTAAYTPGKYTLFGWVTKSSEQYQVYKGACEVLVDISALTTGYEIRSHVKKVLDALEAVIEGRATEKERSVSIGGQAIELMTLAELRQEWLKYKQYYDDEIRADNIANGKETGKKILIKMSNAS